LGEEYRLLSSSLWSTCFVYKCKGTPVWPEIMNETNCFAFNRGFKTGYHQTICKNVQTLITKLLWFWYKVCSLLCILQLSWLWLLKSKHVAVL
jgi:hypothetical protein